MHAHGLVVNGECFRPFDVLWFAFFDDLLVSFCLAFAVLKFLVFHLKNYHKMGARVKYLKLRGKNIISIKMISINISDDRNHKNEEWEKQSMSYPHRRPSSFLAFLNTSCKISG